MQAALPAHRGVNITVEIGLLHDVPVKLAVGASTQVVEVTSAPPAINTTTPDFTGQVEQKVLEDLPVNNYRWSAYPLTSTPAVVADSSGFGLLSFRGQSTLLNNVNIDGVDDNQAFYSEERGRTRAGYSTAKASIQEFQVNTSNYSVGGSTAARPAASSTRLRRAAAIDSMVRIFFRSRYGVGGEEPIYDTPGQGLQAEGLAQTNGVWRRRPDYQGQTVLLLCF